MNSFDFSSVKQIVCEPGAVKNMAAYCTSLHIQRPLIVTDAGLVQTGIPNQVEEILTRGGIHAVQYSNIQADPAESIVFDAVAFAQEHAIDGVIGLGGGSSMDVAKLIALLTQNQQSLASMYGVNKVTANRLPLILVPTTAGTGSEVTPISIITTGETTKSGVVSPRLLPDMAILDAELTTGLPPHVTAATGIDAMVHAIEAFTSKHKKNVYSDMLAKQALTLLSQNILAVVEHGDNVTARSNMLLGALLAGQAFANAPVAAVHALAYPLGGNYHIPHGLSNALVLPAVLKFNAEHAKNQYAELLPCVKKHVPQGLSKTQQCINFISTIDNLVSEVGLPRSLAAMDIPHGDLPKLASEAMEQTRLLVNNPRTVTQADALAIYQHAF
ncbi:iron-containing alcohol dehydrogenase [Alteromonas sp. C1M14]|uniref:iron-containing alcohol dehydrogenase n=1 Tax=Alteromonas sp. C1M14 TaxID=2841567 RepID=UPI001C0965BA|nr:iron-containing alcohol dehydrogenase [Alteromonas sp. C1M14]MBU2980043.1 iron-containing alcohol dehydrogenase [Alteromonas sp. C1M14]